MKNNKETLIHPIIFPTKYSLKSFNSYLVERGDTLTLIDAGIDYDECWEFFIHTLKETRLLVTDIDQVILTHNHEDHTGLIERISTQKDVPIYAHKDAVYRMNRDKDYFSLRVEFYSKLYEEAGSGEFGKNQIEKLIKANKEKKGIHVPITLVKEQDMIAGLQVIETPGHSPDHIVLLDKEQNILFSGDHLVKHISSNAIIEPDLQGNRIPTLKNYIQSLQKCLQLDAKIAYSGHGDEIHNPIELFSYRIERIYQKSEKMLQLIQNGHTTASQIAEAFYRGKYKTEFGLVMSEIIGHLDYLEYQNKIKKDFANGVWIYQVI